MRSPNRAISTEHSQRKAAESTFHAAETLQTTKFEYLIFLKKIAELYLKGPITDESRTAAIASLNSKSSKAKNSEESQIADRLGAAISFWQIDYLEKIEQELRKNPKLADINIVTKYTPEEEILAPEVIAKQRQANAAFIEDLKDNLENVLGLIEIQIKCEENTTDSSKQVGLSANKVSKTREAEFKRIIDLIRNQKETEDDNKIEYHGIFQYLLNSMNGIENNAKNSDFFLLSIKQFTLQLCRLGADSIKKDDEISEAHQMRLERILESLKEFFINFNFACFEGFSLRLNVMVDKYNQEIDRELSISRSIYEEAKQRTIFELAGESESQFNIHFDRLVEYALLPLSLREIANYNVASLYSEIRIEKMLREMMLFGKYVDDAIRNFPINLATKLTQQILNADSQKQQEEREIADDSISAQSDLSQNPQMRFISSINLLLGQHELSNAVDLGILIEDDNYEKFTLKSEKEILEIIASEIARKLPEKLRAEGVARMVDRIDDKPTNSSDQPQLDLVEFEDYFTNLLRDMNEDSAKFRHSSSAITQLIPTIKNLLMPNLMSGDADNAESAKKTTQKTEKNLDELIKTYHVGITLMRLAVNYSITDIERLFIEIISILPIISYHKGKRPPEDNPSLNFLMRFFSNAYDQCINSITPLYQKDGNHMGNLLNFHAKLAILDLEKLTRQKPDFTNKLDLIIEQKSIQEIIQPNNAGYNALIIGAALGNSIIVSTLIKKLKKEQDRKNSSFLEDILGSTQPDTEFFLNAIMLQTSTGSSCLSFLIKNKMFEEIDQILTYLPSEQLFKLCTQKNISDDENQEGNFIHIAVCSGNHELCSKIFDKLSLEQKFTLISEPSNTFATALHIVANDAEHDVNMVEILLKDLTLDQKYKLLSTTDIFGNTPLHIHCLNGSTNSSEKIIQNMLNGFSSDKRKSLISMSCHENCNPIHICAEEGNAGLISEMLTNMSPQDISTLILTPSFNANAEEDRLNSLEFAIKNGHLPALIELLNHLNLQEKIDFFDGKHSNKDLEGDIADLSQYKKPLDYALKSLLMQAKFNHNSNSNDLNSTGHNFFDLNPRIAIVSFLLESGANCKDIPRLIQETGLFKNKNLAIAPEFTPSEANETEQNVTSGSSLISHIEREFDLFRKLACDIENERLLKSAIENIKNYQDAYEILAKFFKQSTEASGLAAASDFCQKSSQPISDPIKKAKISIVDLSGAELHASETKDTSFHFLSLEKDRKRKFGELEEDDLNVKLIKSFLEKSATNPNLRLKISLDLHNKSSFEPSGASNGAAEKPLTISLNHYGAIKFLKPYLEIAKQTTLSNPQSQR